ncbi:MAG: zinc ribbon domain-containing protein, partial [Piscinibacter sp.]|nr:zinc ribbon domain-containing protein [Piscinibacter sp.]
MRHCSACGQGNADEARFCAQCGSALARACAGCGTLLAAQQRFCTQCGRPAEAPEASAAPAAELAADAGERRYATIVFSDLSGYTALNERIDPEEVGLLMAELR